MRIHLLLLLVLVLSSAAWVFAIGLRSSSALTPDPTKFLEVIVVPHSHCDPGWWFTFEDYHQQWTQHILDNIVAMLERNSTRRFMFAEVSFVARWWSQRDDEWRSRFRRVVENGQLEMVTGGWVMHDEAVTHIDAQLTQLELGHRWLRRHLNVRPSAAWLIDPFGHSVTTSLHYGKLGFVGAVMNRIHYRTRERLAAAQELESRWRPQWPSAPGSSVHSMPGADLRIHVLPMGLYGIEHTCGDDQVKCRTFKFAQPDEGTPVNNSNEAQRAADLAHMYRQKSKWYRHEMVLQPLGDDFKWKNMTKADWELSQWERLWRYINAHSDQFRMRVRMGTLSEYFGQLKQRQLPELRHGDLLPYEDQIGAAWTGFYTSRPNLKRAIRNLARALRSLETLDALQVTRESHHQTTASVLEHCRAEHALAQHHDIITGTQRRAVAADGMERLLRCAVQLDEQLARVWPGTQPRGWKARGSPPSAPLAAHRSANEPHPGLPAWHLDEGGAVLDLWNSLAWDRSELVSVELTRNQEAHENGAVEWPEVWVTATSDEQYVTCQLEPVLELHERQWQTAVRRVLLRFRAHTPALARVQYLLHSTGLAGRSCTRASIEIHSPTTSSLTLPGWHAKRVVRAPSPWADLTPHWRVSVETGLVLDATGADGERVALNQTLHEYLNEASGAYLLRISRERSHQLPAAAESVVLVRGPLYASAHSMWVDAGAVIAQSLGAVPDQVGELDVVLHACPEISRWGEWAVRWLAADPEQPFSAWTDRNGYAGAFVQMQQLSPNASRQSTLVRPMVSQAFADGPPGRTTLLTRSTRGVWAAADGTLEVFVARQSSRDDGRGLSEPLADLPPAAGEESPACGPTELRLLLRPARATDQIRFEWPLALALGAVPLPHPRPPSLHGSFPPSLHLQSWTRCGSHLEQHCVRLQHTGDTSQSVTLASTLLEGPQRQCRSGNEWLFGEDELAADAGRCGRLSLEPLEMLTVRLVRSTPLQLNHWLALAAAAILVPLLLLVLLLPRLPAAARHRFMWFVTAPLRASDQRKR